MVKLLLAFSWIFLMTVSLQAYQISKVKPGTKQYDIIRKRIISNAQFKFCSGKQNVNQILPWLYLGNKKSAERVHNMPHITSVLSIISPAEKMGGDHIRWIGIDIRDKPETVVLEHFNDAIEFIETARGDVLVHCRAGVSRSATFVIAYLMWKFDVTADQAYRYVQSKRPQISPNAGFMIQLKYYELVMKENR